MVFNGIAGIADGAEVIFMTTAEIGLSEQATAWLEGRSLDPELATRFGWKSVKDKGGKEWIKIPYVRDGQVINNKSRKLSEKKFFNDRDTEHDLLNVDCLKDEALASEPLIITEGEFDWLAVYQCGFQRSVSMPDGWSKKLESEDGQPKFEVFRRNEQLILSAEKIVAVVDDDETGHNLLRSISNFFDQGNVWYVIYPEGCKDANDVIHKHGPDELVKMINRAKCVDPPGGVITGFSDMPPTPPRTIWRTGCDFLETLVAFRSRDVSALTGLPGAGKTTFVTWVMHRMVKNHDIRCGAALFETDGDETLAHLIKLNGGGDVSHLGPEEIEEWKIKLDRNYRLVHRVDDAENVHGVIWMTKMIHKLAARDGCKIIVIDPWNELEHLPEKGESLTQYTNWALTKLRQLAEKYDVHICVLAHPKKMPRERSRPGGYDISDSAAWFNKPGLGLTIHCEVSEVMGDHVSLTSWKVRSRQQTGCRPGKVRLEYDEASMVYRRLKR